VLGQRFAESFRKRFSIIGHRNTPKWRVFSASCYKNTQGRRHRLGECGMTMRTTENGTFLRVPPQRKSTTPCRTAIAATAGGTGFSLPYFEPKNAHMPMWYAAGLAPVLCKSVSA
jgi:hypothetical protein